MPYTKKAKVTTGSISYSKFILPVYVLLSAVFILYVGYSYFQGVVYNTAAQRGYEQAVVDLMNRIGNQCEQPTALTAGNQQVDVIDVACLQQATPPVNTPVETLDVMENKEG